MDPGRERLGQRRIDHAMSLKPALPPERLRYDINPEMCFSPRPMPGMAFMLVRFIHNADAVRGESYGQLSCDDLSGRLLHGRLEMRVAEIYGG